uniref:OSJNBb0017I01.7 protein n=1 Tax=Oryza sativa subsp. japonica TaxID=39947 RepID=Q7XKE7_ORYSJ|nr:OSJNBb0017I01.7 [Oryza sativa Japonica Group]
MENHSMCPFCAQEEEITNHILIYCVFARTCEESLDAEALACIQALKLANDMGMGHIIVETDAQALKAALLDETHDRSVNAVIIREAKFLLAMNFNVHQVMYCPRECNRAAHELAKIGASLGPRSQFVWLEGFPDDVCNLVASDSAGLPA